MNNMKKILTLLAIALAALTSCNKNADYIRIFEAPVDESVLGAHTEPYRGAIDAFGDCERAIFFSVEANSDYTYDISVSCDKDWCHYNKHNKYSVEDYGSYSIEYYYLKFSCDENTTGEDRTAIFTISAGGKSLRIEVKQLTTPSVTVSTPGTLTQELANKDLLYATSLKISGELNDKDLETIKGLKEVETLDLTGAIIDDLPDEMFSENETIKSIKLPETITTIHPKTFAFSSLEYRGVL